MKNIVSKIRKWLNGLFKTDKKKVTRTAFIIIYQSKAELVDQETGKETYVCGTMFETEKEAWEHVISLTKEGTIVGFNILGITKIETSYPITYAKINYDKDSNGNFKPTITFSSPDET